MQDDVLYPQGRTPIKSKYNSAGKLVFYDANGAELWRHDASVTGGVIRPGSLRNIRTRFTIAQINAGATLLALITGFKYRMITAKAIAIGGAAATGTTVDILATQTTAVKLVAFAQASLTRSTVLTAGGSGAAVLADGASYVQNDVATAITVGKTGSDFATATHIDIDFSYVVEP